MFLTVAVGSVVGACSFVVGWVTSRWKSPPEVPDTSEQFRSEQKPVKVPRKKLNELLPSTYAEYNKLTGEAGKMMQYRVETVKEMNTIAKGLEDKHRGLNLDKLIGSSAGIVGAAVSFVGFTYVLFTPGASALPACVGGAALAAGTTMSVGAHVYAKILESENLTKVKDKKQCGEERQETV
ncbi:hypothetical protein GBAR_LOCUS10493 [Geodia barretti]|uniref:Uncharacterized protein n=1 Tax=Geodia barretti TaxID=519541 RepID=A0AA35WE69_GEOBA|nr:hypothetical protein GBAR_LOCUS10493 [Geodia barretti]